ncbi:polysaccharide deacetylase family protein [Actinomycetospora cinnamomea]|uniref:polysaccharide deacetylase family protein n=1 Tax=Actinomycetospora cinnamomea TaxID=663609 RepID=UPI000E3200A3|nr:polysaccharide deacetylase family protein [Actinomycetospora cinnamomea]
MSNRLLVLGWHNIDPTPAFPEAPEAGRRGFDRQLALLARVANVVRLSDALDRMASGEPLPPRSVALTFDDGYRDNLDVAVPLLAKHGLPATFYLVPRFLSGELGAWWEDLAFAFRHGTADSVEWGGTTYPLGDPAERARAQDEISVALKTLSARSREQAVAELAERLAPVGGEDDRAAFMDWDGARGLLDAGHDVGSHSMTHAILSREDQASQTEELADSRSRLADGLGTSIDSVAYPNGHREDYDETTLRLVAEIGYRGAVTTTPGVARRDQPLMEMNRLIVTPTTSPGDLVGKVWRKARSTARSVLSR